MSKKSADRDSLKRISRRDLIKLAATASVLAGCRALEKVITPTVAPSASAPPTPAPTHTPTTPPSATPTVAASVTPTAAPSATPTAAPSATPTAPPTASGVVVRARHAGVWDGDALAPEALRHMLDASVTALTGLDDAGQAWASLFAPSERIAIKVNTIRSSNYWTHAPLVMAVTERLQAAGVPPEQIIIFDRSSSELERAGYSINQDQPGVRCYGTDGGYTKDFKLIDHAIGLSDILLGCDALINMPVLKHHDLSGLTFAMKNHFGTFDRPEVFHRPLTGQAIAELNAMPPIQDRARLVIGDALTVCPLSRGGWYEAVTADAILMSLDPVAHDAVGLQMLCEVMTSEGHDPAGAVDLANQWLARSVKLGLGIRDPDKIELKELTLG